MTATDVSQARATAPIRTLTGIAAGIIDSFRWSLEVRRRCASHTAQHGRLDGEAISRILAEVDRLHRRRGAGW